MIAIISNAYFGYFITFVCIISSQIFSINCNPIHNNEDVFERRVVSKVSIGKSDSHFANDDKKVNVQTMTRPIMKHRSSETDQFAALSSMMNRENQVVMPHVSHTPHMPQTNFMQINRKPIASNIYKMPFEGPLNDPSKSYYSVQQQKPNDLTVNKISDTFKKNELKKFVLKKILGESYEEEEDDDGFFGGQHLKRYGATGMAAKVFGELIGLKIRESIEDLGKSISSYAKDFTIKGFVSMGNTFNKLFRT